MSSVTIRKSDVERLGKDLIKEVDYFLHDEYIINSLIMNSNLHEFLVLYE